MITRPTNSIGEEVLSMPEETTVPDTQPTELSILFNQIWSSIAHQHNNGSTTAPEYLSHGGVWSRPSDSGLESIVRVSVNGVLTDKQIFWTDGIGASSPFGYIHSVVADGDTLNNLVDGGLHRYTSGALNRPTDISAGVLLVFRVKVATGEVAPISQIIFGDNGNVAVRYREPTTQIWSDWASPSGGGEDFTDDIEILATAISDLQTSVTSLQGEATAKWVILNDVQSYQTNTVKPFITSTEAAFDDIAAALAAILA